MWRKRKPRDLFDFMSELRSEIDRTLGETLYRSGLLPRPERFEPYVDIYETENEVRVTAELPGVKKKDINVNVTEDRLDISAESREELEEERPGIVHRERRLGRFHRSLTLPAKVNPEEAKATYTDGVLKVTLPKIEVGRGRRISIE